MKEERKKTAIIHLGRVKKNYIYFYKQLNGNYAKRGEKKKRHERAQNKLLSAAINPRYRSNDTLSNYTSGKAVTVSWYQLRIISRSVYRLSTIYSRYESKGGGGRSDRRDFFSCKSRINVSPHISLTNSRFQFYFHSTPFLEKEKRVGFAKIYSRIWNIFGDPLKGSRKKKETTNSKCPTSLRWLSASKFRTLKSNISQEDYYGFKKIIIRQFSLTVDPNLRKAIF